MRGRAGPLMRRSGLIRKGHFRKGERIVFLHTGGSAALFGYDHAFASA